MEIGCKKATNIEAKIRSNKMKQCHVCKKNIRTSLEEFGENIFEPVCQSCYLAGLEEVYNFDSRQEFEVKSAEIITKLNISQQDIDKIESYHQNKEEENK